MERAVSIVQGMFGMNGFVGGPFAEIVHTGMSVVELNPWNFGGKKAYAAITALTFVSVVFPNAAEFVRRSVVRRPVIAGCVVSVAAIWTVSSLNKISEFLYFQF